MNDLSPATSRIKTYTSIAGLLYLAIILLGMMGELFVRGKLVVSGNPIVTANNILAHQALWRLGIAGDLLMHMCDIPLMWIIYLLLRQVDKKLALLALLLNMIQTAVLVANKLNLVMVLFVAQKPDEAYSFVKLHGYGFAVGLIFFGLACLVYGHLIFRSGFFPKTIGILLQIAGICYLVSSFGNIISPAFANLLEPYILLPPFIAELSFCLWLLFKGADSAKWQALQA